MNRVVRTWILARGARALSASIVFFSAWAGWSGGVATAAAPIKVACVGGFTVHSDKYSNNREQQPPGMQEYPALLQKLLGPGYFVRNFGDCCASLLQGYPPAETHPYVNGPLAGGGPAFPDSLTFLPDIVVIGSWGRHDWGAKKAPAEVFTVAKFQADYDNLVTRYQALSSHPLIFVSLPIPIPYGEPVPAAPYIPTSSVVPAVQAVAAKYHLPIVDMYQPFLNHKELFLAPPTGEGEHLANPAGLQAMADAVFMAMQQYADGGVVGDGGSGAPPSDDAGLADAGAGVVESGADDAGTTGSSGSSSGGSTGGGTGADAAAGMVQDAATPPTGSSGSSGSSGGNGASYGAPTSNSGSCSAIGARGSASGGASSALTLGVIALLARRRNRARIARSSTR